MKEITDKDAREQEGFDYIRLGKILRKSRTPDKRSAVEKIIAANLSVAQKISEIESIDGENVNSEHSGHDSAKRYGGTSSRKNLPFYANPEYIRQSLIDTAQNRQRIKEVIPRIRILDFFFDARRDFILFSRATGLIDTGLFAFFPKIHAPTVSKLGENLQRELLPKIRPIVKKMIIDGWRHFGKYEYNLIIAFDRLLEAIEKARLTDSLKRDKDWITRFHTLEDSFLLFHAHPDYYDKCLEAIRTYFPIDASRDQEKKKTVSIARMILGLNVMKPSLADFIVALGMVMSHRALTVRSLVAQTCNPLVSLEEWDCSEEIQREIDTYIEELVLKLEPLTADRDQMDSSMYLIPYATGGRLDLSGIPALSGKDAIEVDMKTDIGKFACTLIDRYMAAFGSILEIELETFSMGTVRLIPEHSLDLELGKLGYLRTGIEKLTAQVPFNRFKSIKNGSVSPTHIEAEVISAVSDIASQFCSIGAKISSYIYPLEKEREMSGDDSDERNEGSSTNPLGELLAIPGSEGQTMGEKAGQAGSTAFAIAGFFLDANVIGMIQSKQRVREEIRLTLYMLERLSLTDEYYAIRSHFGLLGF